jgi:hypothetical protein
MLNVSPEYLTNGGRIVSELCFPRKVLRIFHLMKGKRNPRISVNKDSLQMEN